MDQNLKNRIKTYDVYLPALRAAFRRAKEELVDPQRNEFIKDTRKASLVLEWSLLLTFFRLSRRGDVRRNVYFAAICSCLIGGGLGRLWEDQPVDQLLSLIGLVGVASICVVYFVANEVIVRRRDDIIERLEADFGVLSFSLFPNCQSLEDYERLTHSVLRRENVWKQIDDAVRVSPLIAESGWAVLDKAEIDNNSFGSR